MPGTESQPINAPPRLTRQFLDGIERSFLGFLREPTKFSPYPIFTLNLRKTNEVTYDGIATILIMGIRTKQKKGILQLMRVNQETYRQLVNAIDRHQTRAVAVSNIEVYTNRTQEEITTWMRECQRNAPLLGLDEQDITATMESYEAQHKENHGPYDDIRNKAEIMRLRYESQIGLVQKKVQQSGNPKALEHVCWEFGDANGILNLDAIKKGNGGCSLVRFDANPEYETKKTYVNGVTYRVINKKRDPLRDRTSLWAPRKKTHAVLEDSVQHADKLKSAVHINNFQFQGINTDKGYMVTKIFLPEQK